MLQLPANWVILDGRESLDDHGITQYEWTLLQGAPSVDMKVQKGLGMSQVTYWLVMVLPL